jgi:hypothetical protein
MADKLVRDENDAGVIRRDVDMGDGTWAERMASASDLGTPGFMRGREFRSFYEFSTVGGTQIPVSNRVLFKFVLGANMMLEAVELSIDDGAVRVSSHAGGVITGVFSTTLPIIPANSMTGTPAYTALTVITATPAGLAAAVNITGSSVRDVVRVKTPAGGGASNSEVSTVDSVRGLPSGATFYILVENTGIGVVEGTLRLRWQEPAGTA